LKSWEYGYEKNVIRCLQCCLAQAYLHTKWHLDPFRQATLCMLDGTQLSHEKGHSPNFWPTSVVAKQLDGSRFYFIRPMSVVAKRLDGSRCHLVQR